MKRKYWMLTPWFIIFGLAMLLMAILMSVYNIVLFYIELGISVLTFAAVIVLSLGFRSYIRAIVRVTAEHFIGFDADYFEKYKYPIAVSGEKGDIIWCNARFRKNLCGGKSPEGDSINAYIPGFSIVDIADGEGVDVAVDGREFTVYAISGGEGSTVCHFIDNTDYKQAARDLTANMPAVALISFDNAEDFFTDSDESYSNVHISVEANIQGWAMDYNGLYKQLGNNRYMIIFRDADVEKMIAQKFPVLKNVRSISANRHIATISVGLCRGCKLVKDSEMNARKALEMALGRGGDQVAVIRDGNYEFFGGTAAAAEKVSVSSDGLNYLFTLKRDARWHINTNHEDLPEITTKKHYYEMKDVSAKEFIRGMEKDFSGLEELAMLLREGTEKFGQDVDWVDDIATRLLDIFAESLEGRLNERGGIYRAGTGTAMYYIFHATGLGATPDGRRSTEMIPANYSPSLFIREKGPLSVIKSFAKPYLERVINGGPLTLEFDQGIFRNAEAVEKLGQLVHTFIALGGHQLQLNTISLEKLLDARKHPEKYRNLIVRVWGWSGYFVELDTCYQDHVINRIRYRE